MHAGYDFFSDYVANNFDYSAKNYDSTLELTCSRRQLAVVFANLIENFN